jgi:hypothetical protein
MRKYKSEKPAAACTKVIMLIMPLRNYLLGSVILFGLARPECLMGQQPSVAADAQNAREKAAATGEIASLEVPVYPSPLKPFSAELPIANPGIAPAIINQPTYAISRVPHRFWDGENSLLFVAAGGLAAADFCATRANLASGGRELNPVTRVFSGSSAGLATNFALETTATIGVGYLFHKTGHHRLERIASLVDIAGSAGAVAYDRTHR